MATIILLKIFNFFLYFYKLFLILSRCYSLTLKRLGLSQDEKDLFFQKTLFQAVAAWMFRILNKMLIFIRKIQALKKTQTPHITKGGGQPFLFPFWGLHMNIIQKCKHLNPEIIDKHLEDRKQALKLHHSRTDDINQEINQVLGTIIVNIYIYNIYIYVYKGSGKKKKFLGARPLRGRGGG